MTARGRTASRWRCRAAGAAVVLSTCALAACGGGDASAGPPVVTWAVGPDRLDAETLASTCTDQAKGAYVVQVEQLPSDVVERQAALTRRMLAGDDSTDLVSLDSSATEAMAGAGFLAPIPSGQAASLSDGVTPTALAAASHDGRLVVAPWFLDPQVLWFRGNVAERAGLDITKPISWDELVAGAQRLGVTIEIEDRDGSGLAQWVDALVAGAGARMLAVRGGTTDVGLATEAGRTAASIVEFYDQAGVGPGPSEDALDRFAAATGGFLLASTSAVSDPALTAVQADMRATAYPTVAASGRSTAPLAGVGLAVPASARDKEQAFAAIACLTSATSLQSLATGPQHVPARIAVLDDRAVAKAFRTRDVARTAAKTGVTVPATPFWARVVDAVDETWSPIAEVTQDRTPRSSQDAVEAVVTGTLR